MSRKKTNADALKGIIVDERYLVKEPLGAGGMGTVWRAERLEIGRSVAIKFLHSKFATKQDFRRRFEREAIAMSRLYHVNCVSLVDLGVHDGSPYLVMDYVPGPTLSQLLREGPIAPRRAVAITQQLLDGLSYFHHRNVVHRDLKAENVKLVPSRRGPDLVKLLDFGMAKLLAGMGAEISVSKQGVLVGTPGAMAPEQIREQKVDGRTDLYAAGILLFQMLVRRRPFVDDDMVEVFRMHVHTPPPSARGILGTRAMSAELDAVITRALAKDPDDRYQTAEDMADALARTPEGKPVDVAPVEAAPPPAVAARSSFAQRAGWVCAAVLGLALLATAIAPNSVPWLGDDDDRGTTEEPAMTAAAAPKRVEADTAPTPPPERPTAAALKPPAAAPEPAADTRAAPAAVAATATTGQLEWRNHRDQADQHLAAREYRLAWQQLKAILRVNPDARNDPDTIAIMVGVLGLPTGDQYVPTIVREFGNVPAAVDALVDAVPNGRNWYIRHHSLVALSKLREIDRADRVGMWISDLRQARRCTSVRRAYNKLTRSDDTRAVQLVAAVREGSALSVEQGRCLGVVAGATDSDSAPTPQ